jgi:hypothetical protein
MRDFQTPLMSCDGHAKILGLLSDRGKIQNGKKALDVLIRIISYTFLCVNMKNQNKIH